MFSFFNFWVSCHTLVCWTTHTLLFFFSYSAVVWLDYKIKDDVFFFSLAFSMKACKR